VSSGGLGHRWLTPNSWDRGEGEEEKIYIPCGKCTSKMSYATLPILNFEILNIYGPRLGCRQGVFTDLKIKNSKFVQFGF